ncbi:C40 family peptidase [Microlunatus ginsengisoli]|uniref:C40 family peptidase n=2 Tax=Microlunatus ginsengisoli TaxID=363863 RepID=A0ABP6ZSI3_9ACTN
MLSRGRAAGRMKSVVHALGVAVGSLALVASLAGTAAADPTDPPLTVDDAKAQVAELETEAAAIDQEYVGVKEQIKASKAKLKQKQADVAAQTAKVAQMRQQVGQVALAQFQNRSINTTARLFLTEDTDGFLNQVSTVEKVSQNQNSALQDYQSEQAELASLERTTATDLAQLEAQQKSLTDLRSQSDGKISQAKAVLAKLTEEERQRIAAEEARLAQAAAADANSATTGNSDPSGPTDGGGAVAGSGRAAKAIAFAKAQLGKPYRYAAAGPNAYDCSGLTSAAWSAAGVHIDRTSQAQFNDGTSVAKSDLQPGDLVFFYSGISHVAIYVGNGTIIHAPHPGASVRYAKLDSMPYAGARRVG